MTADKVTPLVVRLLHRDCPVTAQTYAASAGIYHRFALGATDSATIPGTPTAEDVVKRWDAIHGARLPHEVDAEALVWGSAHDADAFAVLAQEPPACLSRCGSTAPSPWSPTRDPRSGGIHDSRRHGRRDGGAKKRREAPR